MTQSQEEELRLAALEEARSQANIRVEQLRSKQAQLNVDIDQLTKLEAEQHEQIIRAEALLCEREETRQRAESEARRLAAAADEESARLEQVGRDSEATLEAKSDLVKQLRAQVEASRKAHVRKDKELDKLQTRLAQIETESREQIVHEANLMEQLESLRGQVEFNDRTWPEKERSINAEIEALRKTEITQRKRFAKLEAKLLAQKEASLIKASAKSKTTAKSKATARVKPEDARVAVLEAFCRETEKANNQHSKKEAELRQKIQELCKSETEHVQRLEAAKAQLSELKAVKTSAEQSHQSEPTPATDVAELDLSFELSEPPIELLSHEVEVVETEQSSEEAEIRQLEVTVVHEEPAIVDSPTTGYEEETTTPELASFEMVETEVKLDFSTDFEEAPVWHEPEVVSYEAETLSKSLDIKQAEKSIQPTSEQTSDVSQWTEHFKSGDLEVRADAVRRLADFDEDQAFHLVTNLFDDESEEVRNNAARALYDLRPNRADSFTRALREASPEGRRRIAKALDGSGLAAEAISGLAGESRERTYDSFSILFLMAKAGETEMLLKTIENHPNMAIQLSVIKLLTFSNQPDIVAKFRSLAVKGALPTEVRSAVMESIYQISSNARQNAVAVN